MSGNASLDRKIYSFFKKGQWEDILVVQKTFPISTAEQYALKAYGIVDAAGAGACKFALFGNMLLNTGALVAEVWGGYSKTKLSGGQATGQVGAHYFEFIVDSGVSNMPSGGVIQLASWVNGTLNAESGFIQLRDYGTSPMGNLFHINSEITSGSGKMWYGRTLKIRVGGATKYIALSDTENSLAATGVAISLAPVPAGAGLKIHVHAATGAVYDYANEFKGESVKTSGFYDAIAVDYKLEGTGTSILRGVRAAVQLSSGYTMNGTDYTTQSMLAAGVFSASVSGVLSGAGVTVAGVLGQIGSNNLGTLTTCKYMAAVWADWASLVELGTGDSAIILATVGEGAGAAVVDYGLLMVGGGHVTTGIGMSGAMTTGISIAEATTGLSIVTSTLSIYATKTFASQSVENMLADLSLITDSTFLTGTNITYSSARGSSILKLAGTYSAAAGGFEGIDLKIATSGAFLTDNDGVIGIKTVVTNTAALADGNIYGGQFIAKHNHASNDMTAQACLIGLEAIAYNSDTGDVGTAFGLNVVMRNYGAGGSGSVHAGIQVVLDQAGGTKATEATGIRIWNMAGTWDAALRITGAFTALINFVDATTCYAVITGAPTTITGQILVTMPNGSTGYIPVYSTTGT